MKRSTPQSAAILEARNALADSAENLGYWTRQAQVRKYPAGIAQAERLRDAFRQEHAARQAALDALQPQPVSLKP